MLGPFPNPGDGGLARAYPPEKEIDYDAGYKAKAAARFAWTVTDSAERGRKVQADGIRH